MTNNVFEVYVDYAQHPTVPALIQVFVDANSGHQIKPETLIGYTLTEVFPDSIGRKIMVYKMLSNH
ncbi:hypothetical protein PP175_25505 (plasmid) [Aneurinibacillus sp. Ricciae_BoGa-3]|uniref:hypothetical protein n=1 Tax=Aneurinibacillus sp. Ricciae_BoGa-3 TaxID=3022697 RepID=UPI002342100F|nr:hypothetical protein [Aneurinibacillus sp. Ricciae_BoGa-3]WCK57427.1 hypothetical protein PP175_25505 [Aneurinibacillus sp. Ricciae_BoGa-3]